MGLNALNIQPQDFTKSTTGNTYRALIKDYEAAKDSLGSASLHIVNLRHLVDRGYKAYQSKLAPAADPKKLKEAQIALHALQLRLSGIYKSAQNLLSNFENGITRLDRQPLSSSTMATIEAMSPDHRKGIEKLRDECEGQLKTLRTTHDLIASKCSYLQTQEPKLISSIHYFDSIVNQGGDQLNPFSRVYNSTPFSFYNTFEKEVSEKEDALKPLIEQILKGSPLEELAAVSEPAGEKDNKGQPVGAQDVIIELEQEPSAQSDQQGSKEPLASKKEKNKLEVGSSTSAAPVKSSQSSTSARLGPPPALKKPLQGTTQIPRTPSKQDVRKKKEETIEKEEIIEV